MGAVLWRCCQLYNAALEERRDAYRKQKLVRSFYDQCKGLTQLRAEDSEWCDLDVTMLRMTVLQRVHRAYQGFFRRVKCGKTPGFPRFKGRDRFDTLVFGTSGWKLRGKKLVVRGVGRFQVTAEPHRTGVAKGLRLVEKGGCWYAHIVYDIGPAPAVQSATNGVGIDVGLKTFATLSNGERVAHPRFVRKSAEELAAAQRVVSRRKKGSARRAKAKRVVARVYERVANRRRNFVRQTAASLSKRYDGFAVEGLKIQEMGESSELTLAQNCGMRRGIMDSAWRMFFDALAAKAEEAGQPFVRVNPKGTTQRCSGCGSVVRKGLRDRVHDCGACGLVLDRDENAARNIHDLGWRSAGNRAGHGVEGCGGS